MDEYRGPDEHPAEGEAAAENGAATSRPRQPESSPREGYPPPAPREPQRYAPPAYGYAPARPQRERSASRNAGGGRTFLVALLGAVVGAAAAAVVVLAVITPTSSSSTVSTQSGPTVTTTPRSNAVLATQPIEIAAADALPSVVNIAIDTPSGSGVGSGVIIRSNGYVLTNFHVVQDATSIQVSAGAQTYAGRVVGTDQVSDLAVVKIDKTGLRAAAIGNSSNLVTGETVLAVGSPFGLDKTVTSGIVSALHRSNIVQGSNTGVASYQDLIQTDAAINPGNSGGALVDMSGAVVGINTLIESPSGQLGASQSAGIGFAIPIDYAVNIADQLISGVTITHPYVGITAATVSPTLAQIYGLPRDNGALVTQVDPGSPAQRAGIRPGDIVAAMGSTTITSADELYVALLKAKVGTPIDFHVTHLSGSTSTIAITPVAR